jgi:Family of unknown function (DUF6758)
VLTHSAGTVSEEQNGGVSLAVSCPRCGGEVRPPDLMRSGWLCDRDGLVDPLHTWSHISAEILSAVRDRVRRSNGEDGTMSLWCPWPLMRGWTVTGVGWAGDDRTGVRATAVALSGPAPLQDGPADAVFVAEEMGVGLGAGLAGMPGPDPGPGLGQAVASAEADAKVRVEAHPCPLWMVPSLEDRSAYAGEAQGRWLSVIIWPAAAGYLLAEEIILRDLVDYLPTELVFGAPSWRLRAGRQGG